MVSEVGKSERKFVCVLQYVLFELLWKIVVSFIYAYAIQKFDRQVQMAQQQQQQQMPPDPASSGPGTGASGPAPSAPRKFAYLKHLTALHKDQHVKLQAKNTQVRNFSKINMFTKELMIRFVLESYYIHYIY